MTDLLLYDKTPLRDRTPVVGWGFYEVTAPLPCGEPPAFDKMASGAVPALRTGTGTGAPRSRRIVLSAVVTTVLSSAIMNDPDDVSARTQTWFGVTGPRPGSASQDPDLVRRHPHSAGTHMLSFPPGRMLLADTERWRGRVLSSPVLTGGLRKLIGLEPMSSGRPPGMYGWGPCRRTVRGRPTRRRPTHGRPHAGGVHARPEFTRRSAGVR